MTFEIKRFICSFCFQHSKLMSDLTKLHQIISYLFKLAIFKTLVQPCVTTGFSQSSIEKQVIRPLI